MVYDVCNDVLGLGKNSTHAIPLLAQHLTLDDETIRKINSITVCPSRTCDYKYENELDMFVPLLSDNLDETFLQLNVFIWSRILFYIFATRAFNKQSTTLYLQRSHKNVNIYRKLY